jgi:hypothetical protein
MNTRVINLLGRSLSTLCLAAAIMGTPAGAAFAQTPAPQAPAPAAGAAAEDDDAQLRAAEPDFRLVNLPTTARLPRHGMSFSLTHRFNGNLRDGTFGDQLGSLFGMDSGASIGLEFRYAPVRRVQAIFFRTNIDRAIQFTGKFDAVRQEKGMPIGISAIVAVEGGNNFRRDRLPSLGVVVSHTISDRVAVYAMPMWVHDTGRLAGLDQDTTFIGLGGRVRAFGRVYLVAEVSPRTGGYRPGDAEYAFGIEKRVGGHVFQLNFTNGPKTTFGQLAQGGFPNQLQLGFNLGRKFY